MERTLRRHKNKVHPRKPETLSDVVKAYDDQTIMLNYGLNLRKTDRFYINTVYGESFEFTLFASFQIIRLIEDHIPPENRHYSMDGTFDMTPLKCFYQLLIIHIEYGKSVSLYLIILNRMMLNADSNVGWMDVWMYVWMFGCMDGKTEIRYI